MRKAIVSIIALAIATAAHAGVSDVEKRLKEKYPSTKITEVRESAVNGIYEVVMGRNIAYTDESGRYMIFGHLFDMKEQKDLTAQRLDEVNKVDVSALPLSDAIKTVKGNGARKIYVFSDPDCPFCKRLERETIPLLDNVTIYTFPYPLVGLHKDADRKAKAIWCAKDRAKAWADYAQTGRLPDAVEKCDDPIERNVRLGASLGINGTPTIIMSDGTMVPGFVTADVLNKRMGGDKTVAAAAAGGK